MKQEELVVKILEVLSPMPDVIAIKSKAHIVLYKDGVMFGKIVEQSVLLLSNNNKFIKVDTELITRLFLYLKTKLTNLTVIHSYLKLLSPGGWLKVRYGLFQLQKDF